jgi:Family of unknown function (DUF6519)
MKGDYSRDTFNPAKHFTRVLMQQGRVQLDSDWNEQGAILLHYLQTLAADLIGPYGGPLDQLGFGIEAISPDNQPDKLTDLSISVGRYYVDGILCENYPQSTNVMQPKIPARTLEGVEMVGKTTGGHSQSYRHQVNYPMDPQSEEFKKDLVLPLFVYLDVWERHITALEDDEIREVALGGPDTAARAKVVWQVKIDQEEIGGGAETAKLTCEIFDNEEKMTAYKKRKHLQPDNRGMLRARAYVPETSSDVCIVSPEARYRGAENQLYRVEIHQGSNASGHPTFKWSRENGSTIYPIQSLSDKTVFLESLGRDERFGLEVGDWVEVVDDDYTLLGKADRLLRVEALDPIAMMVTLNKAPQHNVGQDQHRHPLLRRWDQQQGDPKTGGLTLTDGAAEIIERTERNSHWLNLEDGVQVQFRPGGTYRQGDYWLIPARTATGDVEWPGPPDNPTPMPPNGVEHHYAPLAIVVKVEDPDPHFMVIDLRHRIDPLSKCVCPKIEVVIDESKSGPNTIAFAARVDGGGSALIYTWTPTATGGTITSTTPQAGKFVVTLGTGVSEVSVEVDVDGLPLGCLKKASATWIRPPA